MIAVDTSALMAIVLGEPNADACIRVLEAETEVLISAATVAEALIVASRRNVDSEMARLIDGLGLEIITVTPASARRIAKAYERWGRGLHPAGLNFGDCFSYEVAMEDSCRLLFAGDDFSEDGCAKRPIVTSRDRGRRSRRTSVRI
jgi:ribonuclease VapC